MFFGLSNTELTGDLCGKCFCGAMGWKNVWRWQGVGGDEATAGGRHESEGKFRRKEKGRGGQVFGRGRNMLDVSEK